MAQPMSGHTWQITYDDADEITTVDVTGKLSLDDSWVFALDLDGPQPVISLAIPQHRVVDVRLID